MMFLCRGSVQGCHTGGSLLGVRQCLDQRPLGGKFLREVLDFTLLNIPSRLLLFERIDQYRNDTQVIH